MIISRRSSAAVSGSLRMPKSLMMSNGIAANDVMNSLLSADEAVPVHHLLPKGHGVATAGQPTFYEFAKGFTGDGGRWRRGCGGL